MAKLTVTPLSFLIYHLLFSVPFLLMECCLAVLFLWDISVQVAAMCSPPHWQLFHLCSFLLPTRPSVPAVTWHRKLCLQDYQSTVFAGAARRNKFPSSFSQACHPFQLHRRWTRTSQRFNACWRSPAVHSSSASALYFPSTSVLKDESNDNVGF